MNQEILSLSLSLSKYEILRSGEMRNERYDSMSPAEPHEVDDCAESHQKGPGSIMDFRLKIINLLKNNLFL